MYYFYKLDFHNEATNSLDTQRGLLRAETCIEALKLITEDYGEECIEKVVIECSFIDTNCIEFDEIQDYLNKEQAQS